MTLNCPQIILNQLQSALGSGANIENIVTKTGRQVHTYIPFIILA